MGDAWRWRHEVGDDPARVAEVDAAVRAVDPDARTAFDPASGRISVLTVMVPALLERLIHDLDDRHAARSGPPAGGCCGGCDGRRCRRDDARSATTPLRPGGA